MQVRIVRVSYNDLNEDPRFGEMLRGYLGNKYIDNDLLHNHDGNKVLYRYPMVQYKVIDRIPMILGVGDGAKVVEDIGIKEDCFTIKDRDVESFQTSIEKSDFSFGLNDDYRAYEFKTPWIALNQKNIGEYRKLNSIGKEEFLKRIIIGNIISISKGFGYQVDDKICCWIDVKEKAVNIKNVKHVGFVGRFKVNFNIPDYLGIGKMVSRGFGTIKGV